MRLTVLGRYGPYPEAGGACSGYLVEDQDTRILLDCGSGVLSRLQRFLPIQGLTAVILSHLHADHMADALILRYFLQIEQTRGRMEKKPLPVYLPDEPADVYGMLSSVPEFTSHRIDDGMRIQIGTLKVTFRAMMHSVPSFGVRLENGESCLCYTGDTGYHDGIAPFAEGATLFLPDTGFLAADKPAENPNHMTPAESAGIAASAGVKQLLMTHLWPGYEEEAIISEARPVFPNAQIAREGERYTL
jgi:ribonuclease BN (tRNA processing enzyme)